MKTATTVVHMLIRVTGVIQIALGLLFWTGNAQTLIPVHMLVGMILVLSLWTLAILAARSGVNRWAVILALVWGLIVPIVGVTQTQLLPGSVHWLIGVAHLLLGLGAIGQAEGLAAQMKGRSTAAVRS